MNRPSDMCVGIMLGAVTVGVIDYVWPTRTLAGLLLGLVIFCALQLLIDRFKHD